MYFSRQGCVDELFLRFRLRTSLKTLIRSGVAWPAGNIGLDDEAGDPLAVRQPRSEVPRVFL